jgi:hypothetical protein
MSSQSLLTWRNVRLAPNRSRPCTVRRLRGGGAPEPTPHGRKPARLRPPSQCALSRVLPRSLHGVRPDDRFQGPPPCARSLVSGPVFGTPRARSWQRQLRHHRRDFNRFGFDTKATLDALPGSVALKRDLHNLNEWRNAAAHQNTALPAQPLTVPMIQGWRNPCDTWAMSLDAIMYNQLRRRLRRGPWLP